MDGLRKRQGQSTVEFAIVASLLFFFVFAVVEFGAWRFDRLTAGESAYELARTIVVGGDDADRVAQINARLGGVKEAEIWLTYRQENGELTQSINKVKNGLTSISAKNIHINTDAAVADGKVRVIVKAQPRFHFSLVSAVAPGGISSEAVEMRMEK